MALDITPYKLPDEAFFESSDRGADPLARELVGEHRGLLVDLPSRVDIDRRDTLPGAVYHLGEIRELAAVPFDRFGIVTAVNLDDHRLYGAVGAALGADEDPIEAPPTDPALFPDGDLSTTYPVDFRKLLGIPWQPGRYLVTALQRESVSNRALVELHGAAEPSLAGAGKSDDDGLLPAHQLDVDAYQAQPDSPAIPEAHGIVLATTRVAVLGPDLPWPVHGAYRLSDRPGQQPWSIHLVVHGADDGYMELITLRVPPTGFFNIDLRRFTRLRTPQTYFLSAFSGALLTPPVPTALVPGTP